MMDLDLISKGKEYHELKKSIVIFICVIQPFEQSGRHRYVFEKRCVQETELALNDGVTTVILSARGDKDDIDPEMRAFLRYLENSSDEVAEASDSGLVRRIHTKVRAVKQNRVREAEYMKLLERDRENREKGRQEGLSLGREEGRQKLQKVLFDLVKDGTLTISAAAEKAELEPSEFERRYYENLQ